MRIVGVAYTCGTVTRSAAAPGEGDTVGVAAARPRGGSALAGGTAVSTTAYWRPEAAFPRAVTTAATKSSSAARRVLESVETKTRQTPADSSFPPAASFCRARGGTRVALESTSSIRCYVDQRPPRRLTKYAAREAAALSWTTDTLHPFAAAADSTAPDLNNTRGANTAKGETATLELMALRGLTKVA